MLQAVQVLGMPRCVYVALEAVRPAVFGSQFSLKWLLSRNICFHVKGRPEDLELGARGPAPLPAECRVLGSLGAALPARPCAPGQACAHCFYCEM